MIHLWNLFLVIFLTVSPTQAVFPISWSVTADTPSLPTQQTVTLPGYAVNVIAKAQSYVNEQDHYITGGHGEYSEKNPYHLVTRNVNNYCYTFPNNGDCSTHRHFDCVGLVYRAFEETGQLDRLYPGEPWGVLNILRYWQKNYPDRVHYDVDWPDKQPGDVVILSQAQHIGIAAPGDRLIHAYGYPCGHPEGCEGSGVLNDSFDKWRREFRAYLDIDWTDNAPPVTTVQVTGETGDNDWYISPIVVALDPQDDPGGVGIAAVQWNLDNTGWKDYQQPIFIQTEGTHEFYFRSRDQVNHWEELQKLELKIDTTSPVNPPDALTNCPPGKVCSGLRLTWSPAFDSGSGLAGYQIYWGIQPLGTSTDWVVFPQYTPENFPSSTAYFRIRAQDNAGHWSKWALLAELRPSGDPAPTLVTSLSEIPIANTVQVVSNPTASTSRQENLSETPTPISVNERQGWPLAATVVVGIFTTALLIAGGIALRKSL